MSTPQPVPARAGSRPASRHSRRSRRFCVALALLLAPSWALGEAATKAQMQSLDEQVQEIKSDVLAIAAELSQLEERLLFPSNTQVAVFVSLDADEDFQLDAIAIEIDGQPATRHVYTWKELEALRKGGVQRIYTGNVAIGAHRIDVQMSGKRSGSDVETREHFSFQKEAGPKLVELSLAGSGIRLEGGES